MLKFKSTIFSDENDIYIALQSNKAKLSSNTLRKIAFKRGTIYPATFERDDLINHISDLPFSYSHLMELTNRLTPKINRDQYSVKRIIGDFDLSKLNDVVEKVKEGRPRFVGAEHIIPSKTIQAFYVDIDYTEFDFTRGKYQQKKRHAGYIQFLEKSGYISIQYTYTKRIQSILNDIIAMYRDTESKLFEVQNIDLSAVLDASLRNQFMINLYGTSTQFMFLELEKVRVSKVHSLLDAAIEDHTSENMEEDFSDDLDSDLMGDDDGDQSEQLMSSEDNREYSIDNAQFDGQLLNDAEEVKNLCENNFYRSRIKWTSKALSLKEKPIVTFELAFDDKHRAKDLKFRILGKESVDGKGGKEPVDGADFDIIIRELEDIIFKSLDDVLTAHESSTTGLKEVSHA